jgi:small redox-active disulfide protein 2
MHTIKVLGSGCRNCVRTAKLIEQIAQDQGIDATIEKVEDLPSIMAYGVMSTPGVVIDEKVVHAGGVPTRKQIIGWLSELA